MKGRKEFLEAVAENPQMIQYVKLFRMPLFLTMLDEELKKYDDAVWSEESSVKETALTVMRSPMQQFGFPQEETDKVIGECVAAFMKA